MKFLTGSLVLGLAAAAPAVGDVISINISNGTDLASGDIAGVVPASNWNNIDVSGGPTVAPTALNDSAGVGAGATFESTYTTSFNSLSGAGTGDANSTMMEGYMSVDITGDGGAEDSGQINIAGLGGVFTGDPDGYSVIVYFDTDVNGQNATPRNHTVTLTPDNAAAVSQTGLDNGTYAGAFVQASGAGVDANYMVFSGLTAASFTLSMDSDVGRGAYNGIQIVNEIPEPGSLALLGVGGLLVARRRRV